MKRRIIDINPLKALETAKSFKTALRGFSLIDTDKCFLLNKLALFNESQANYMQNCSHRRGKFTSRSAGHKIFLLYRKKFPIKQKTTSLPFSIDLWFFFIQKYCRLFFEHLGILCFFNSFARLYPPQTAAHSLFSELIIYFHPVLIKLHRALLIEFYDASEGGFPFSVIADTVFRKDYYFRSK